VTADRYAGITYKIIGAAMRVHNELGPGLKEITYHNALSAAMRDAGLSFEEEKPLEINLGEEEVGLLYIDHFVEEAIVLEEKAFPHLLTSDEVAQILTYMAVTESPLGLLLNFGRRSLEYKRILPPKKYLDWRERAARYAWRPKEALSSSPKAPRIIPRHPLISSKSAGESREP
jgi:GxxExxY protein